MFARPEMVACTPGAPFHFLLLLREVLRPGGSWSCPSGLGGFPNPGWGQSPRCVCRGLVGVCARRAASPPGLGCAGAWARNRGPLRRPHPLSHLRATRWLDSVPRHSDSKLEMVARGAWKASLDEMRKEAAPFEGALGGHGLGSAHVPLSPVPLPTSSGT